MTSPRGDSMAMLALLLFPHGGQRVARRNAHAAMTLAHDRAQARQEVIYALQSLGSHASLERRATIDEQGRQAT